MNTGPLTAGEVDGYRRNGFVAPPGVRLAAESCRTLRRSTGAIIDAGIDPDLILIAHIPARDGVSGGVICGEDIFRIAVDPVIIAVVEQLLGPDIVLWGSSIFAKPGLQGKPVQWHQEANYWPMEPLVTTSIWIAVDDATEENGCLKFIPGSHAHGLLAHGPTGTDGVLDISIRAGLVDDRQAVSAPVRAGGVVALDTFVIHGSNPNRSPARRAALTLRYMPATSFFRRDAGEFALGESNVTGWAQRPIWLVRGVNREPRNDFTVGHTGLEDLDTLAAAARAC